MDSLSIPAPQASLTGLPVELKTMIFKQLPTKTSLKNVRLVCKDFQDIVRSLIYDEIKLCVSSSLSETGNENEENCALRLIVDPYDYASIEDRFADFLKSFPRDHYWQVNILSAHEDCVQNKISVENLVLLLDTQRKLRELEVPIICDFPHDSALAQVAGSVSRLRSLEFVLQLESLDVHRYSRLFSLCSPVPDLYLNIVPVFPTDDDDDYALYSRPPTGLDALYQPSIAMNLVRLNLIEMDLDSIVYEFEDLHFNRLEALELHYCEDPHVFLQKLKKVPTLSALHVRQQMRPVDVDTDSLRSSLTLLLSKPCQFRELVLHVYMEALPPVSVLALHGPTLRLLEVLGPTELNGQIPCYGVEDMVVLMKQCIRLRHLSVALPSYNRRPGPAGRDLQSHFEAQFFKDTLMKALAEAPALYSLYFHMHIGAANKECREWFQNPDDNESDARTLIDPLANIAHTNFSKDTNVTSRVLSIALYIDGEGRVNQFNGRYFLRKSSNAVHYLTNEQWKDSLIEFDEELLDSHFYEDFFRAHTGLW